ncbi:triose-phosphate isomerase [Ideonella sp. BN130291]|uniref:triose-phosphate isomerase n=1 Tax=Ideonella sp. BN130291 TaxID=3112940 RepID=UPI002E25F3CF|nr:triose-phosphate isomerase [Ideonella sp. BN130291]
MSAPPLVVGNWKMHGSTALVRALADLARQGWPACEAAVCLPHPLLAAAQMAFAGTPLRWGAQDCSCEAEGPFTGEVAPGLIRHFGARFVIVGHSERRDRHGETDGQVAAKAQRALAEGLTPIVCVGEKAEERDGDQTAATLRRQLLPLMRGLGRDLASVVIAYEPVWAIGSKDAATPGLIEDAHAFIADTLLFHTGLSARAVRIVYGGSVTPNNADAILARQGVGGLLVGGASLAPAEFLAVCQAAARCAHRLERRGAGGSTAPGSTPAD